MVEIKPTRILKPVPPQPSSVSSVTRNLNAPGRQKTAAIPSNVTTVTSATAPTCLAPGNTSVSHAITTIDIARSREEPTGKYKAVIGKPVSTGIPTTKHGLVCTASLPSGARINSPILKNDDTPVSEKPADKKVSSKKTRRNDPSIPNLNPGKIINNRYVIIEELGRGGLGVVYKALDKKTNTEVAFKAFSSDSDLAKFAPHEYRATAKVSAKHPNLANVLEQGIFTLPNEENEEIEHHFITFECYSGENLRQRIHEGESLSLAEAMEITLQTSYALTAAHNVGVVHRDVKPDNIFLEKTSDGSVKVHLLDFGLAKIMGEEDIIKPNQLAGTAEYMAPEIGTGVEIDQRTDIYSLGFLIYRIANRSNPYSDEHPLKIIALKRNNTLPRPNLPALQRETENGMTDLIYNMVKRAPEDRPVSLKELEEDMARLQWQLELEGTGVTHSKPSLRVTLGELTGELPSIKEKKPPQSVVKPDSVLPLSKTRLGLGPVTDVKKTLARAAVVGKDGINIVPAQESPAQQAGKNPEEEVG